MMVDGPATGHYLRKDASLEVRVLGLPLGDGRNDAERDDLVTHLAEVLVRSLEA